MNRSSLIAQHVLAGAIVFAVLGAAAAGLSLEMVRRGVCWAWGRA